MTDPVKSPTIGIDRHRAVHGLGRIPGALGPACCVDGWIVDIISVALTMNLESQHFSRSSWKLANFMQLCSLGRS